MRGNFRFSILDFGLSRASRRTRVVVEIQNPKSKIQNFGRRRGFTLTELMIVIAIMAILAGLGVSAMSGATNLAREHRAGTMIDKIDQLIMERYEGYRTRTVPVKILPGTLPRVAAMIRLNGLRDLMRMELPDRKSDVMDPPCDLVPDVAGAPPLVLPFNAAYNPRGLAQPSMQRAYQRIA